MAAISHVDGAVDLSAGASYVGGALPSDGDTLTFNRAGASFELTNLTALNGKDLLTLTIGPAWAASIGTSAQALEVNCNRSGAGAVDYKGTGRVFSIKGGASTPTISTITFRPSNGASSVGFLSGAANTMLRVFGGAFRVENSATVVAVQAMRSRVEIMEHASDSVGDMVLAEGATATLKRLLGGTVNVGPGCTLIYDVKSTTDSGVITISGGKVIWKNGALVVNGQAGELDRSGLEATYALTITEYPGLTERTGAVEPTASRTAIAGGSKKI